LPHAGKTPIHIQRAFGFKQRHLSLTKNKLLIDNFTSFLNLEGIKKYLEIKKWG
jgi:hypothetical protein